MIPAAFAYVRPESLDEALAALADPDARPIAGGHSLLPMMKLRFAQPALLVDLAGLALGGVRVDGDLLRVGAMTTYDDLLEADDVPDALRECVEAVGDQQVRNAGTLGGALAHGDPASDVAAGVIALGARLRLRSPAGERECAAEDFFLGPFTTQLAQQELLEEIIVPRTRPGEGSAYSSVEDRASGYPLAGAAVRVTVVDGRLASCTVGLTGVGTHPERATAVEAALVAGGELEPMGDGPYRRRLAEVVVRRAVATALERAAR